MQKFTDLIALSEARRQVGMKIPYMDSGLTPEMLLADLYHEFDTQTFTNRDARKVKGAYGKINKKTAYNLQQDLIKLKYLEKEGSKADAVLNLTQEGIDYINKNKPQGVVHGNATPVQTENPDSPKDPEDASIAKGAKDITKTKVRKFKVPKVGKNSKYKEQMKTILTHMDAVATSVSKSSFMLAGDPGTGKTSFIKSLSDLTGVPLVIVEAPHITQEHIINIPFLVLDGDKKKHGNLTLDDTAGEMKVVQSESNLVTQLKSKKKRTPEQIQKTIDKNKALRDVQPKLKKRIELVQKEYNTILFLDEFYRTSSIKIRNVLRNILNGKIGNDKIPKGVYIIMASNFGDDGVEDIPLNQDFEIMDYDVSSKEDFMNYMYGKYVTDTESNDPEAQKPKENSIAPDVWNKFMDVLSDKDLGFNDEDADVRLSPRRIEQIILYVNASIPPDSLDDARALKTFIEVNLTNYLTNESSEIKQKFQDIVDDLMPEEYSNVLPLPQTEWRSTLAHEMKMKMKLGDSRSYVPVASGAPGIGKTTVFADIAREQNLGFIQFDVSNLSAEDITGMPIADTSRGTDNITTRFSEPNMYISIMKEYNNIIEEHRVQGRKYNVILLLDELNRTEIPVFNAIRQVLLEKKFSDNTKLPDDIMITAAINPVDVGAIEFTSHTRDVLDIIPSAQSSVKLFEYIKGKPQLLKIDKELGFNLTEACTKCMMALCSEFGSTTDVEENPVSSEESAFWWSVQGSKFYISGREITESIASAVAGAKSSLIMDMNFDKNSSYTEEEFDAFIEEALIETINAFTRKLKMVFVKQDIPMDTTNLVAGKMKGTSKFTSFFQGIKSIKSEQEIPLTQILENANYDYEYLDKGVLGNYLRYTQPSEFIQDVSKVQHRILEIHTDKIQVLEDSLTFLLRLRKSLTQDKNLRNDYLDNLRRNAKEFVKNIVKDETFPLIDFMKNNKPLLHKLGEINEF